MKQVELMSLVELTFRAVFRHDDQINSCLLLNEEILEPIRRSRSVSVVYNPILSVRIAPAYACILKPLAAGDDLKIQFKLIVERVILTTMRCFVEGHQLS